MPSVTLVCRECDYKARRELTDEPGSRGVHETSSEPGFCPKGHGLLVREDGVEQERWACWNRPPTAIECEHHDCRCATAAKLAAMGLTREAVEAHGRKVRCVRTAA